MKNTNQNFHHIQGAQAYQIYWEQHYRCKPRLSSVMAIDLNLDIIIDDEGILLAYRYDLPEDMQELTAKCGHWKYHEREIILHDTLQKFQQMLIMLRFNISSN